MTPKTKTNNMSHFVFVCSDFLSLALFLLWGIACCVVRFYLMMLCVCMYVYIYIYDSSYFLSFLFSVPLIQESYCIVCLLLLLRALTVIAYVYAYMYSSGAALASYDSPICPLPSSSTLLSHENTHLHT